MTDADVVKEAKPSFYKKHILPILHKNRVVHFLGFGNRLASDPLPLQVQVNLSNLILGFLVDFSVFRFIFSFSLIPTISTLVPDFWVLHLETSMQMQFSCSEICSED